MSLRPLAAICLTIAAFAVAVAFQDPAVAPPPRVTAPSPLTTSPPQYWKGNLHTHTLWSDGDDFPVQHTTHRRMSWSSSLATPPTRSGCGNNWNNTATTLYKPNRHGPARNTVLLHQPHVLSKPKQLRDS